MSSPLVFDLESKLENVKQISVGIHRLRIYSLALLEDGRVIGWGERDKSFTNPVLENFPVYLQNGTKKIKQISAGYEHALALLNNGEVISWGNLDNMINCPPPGLKDVEKVSAGINYSLALLKDGTIIGWGRDLEIPPELKTVQNNENEKVIQISTNGDVLLALLKNGKLRGNSIYIPKDLKNGTKKVIQISVGLTYSLALLEDGTVIYWIDNPGPRKVEEYKHIIERISKLKYVKQISAGYEFIYSLALLESGKIISFGNSQFPSNLINIEFNENNKVKEICAGFDHSLALLKSGKVIGWGNKSNRKNWNQKIIVTNTYIKPLNIQQNATQNATQNVTQNVTQNARQNTQEINSITNTCKFMDELLIMNYYVYLRQTIFVMMEVNYNNFDNLLQSFRRILLKLKTYNINDFSKSKSLILLSIKVLDYIKLQSSYFQKLYIETFIAAFENSEEISSLNEIVEKTILSLSNVVLIINKNIKKEEYNTKREEYNKIKNIIHPLYKNRYGVNNFTYASRGGKSKKTVVKKKSKDDKSKKKRVVKKTSKDSKSKIISKK
jgi:alpha-tubulin suppressor-like RCC1 family protein